MPTFNPSKHPRGRGGRFGVGTPGTLPSWLRQRVRSGKTSRRAAVRVARRRRRVFTLLDTPTHRQFRRGVNRANRGGRFGGAKFSAAKGRRVKPGGKGNFTRRGPRRR